MNTQSLEQSLQGVYREKGGAIGVCGLPGSGKSTLVRKLTTIFYGRALSINLDDFCIAPTALRKSFLNEAIQNADIAKLQSLAAPNASENPYANPLTWYDWSAAADVIRRVKRGEEVLRDNCWDQETGLCNKTMRYVPPKGGNPLYFIDCVYLFEEPVADEIDGRIMIDLPLDKANERQAGRDMHRNEDAYLRYKNIVTDLYCVPYLDKNRSNMDFIVS